MKSLVEYILESTNKQIDLDNINDKELKKFAKDVTIKVNAKYHLDYKFDEDFVFNAISKLKNKKLKVSVNDFNMYEADNGEECLYCDPIKQYYDSDPRKGWLDI